MSDEILRRVRHALGQAEDDLDHALAALDHVPEPLQPEWRNEFVTDMEIIKDKTAKLGEAVNTHP